MKRDMDFIRDLLLKIEAGQTGFETISIEAARHLGFEPEEALTSEKAHKLEGHLDLLEEAGFITIGMRSGAGTVIVDAITWRGHEFLDAVRDVEIWTKTKDASKKAGVGAIEFVWGIAKEIAKSEIRQKLGFDLG